MIFFDFDLVAPYDPEVCGPDKLGAGKKIHTLGLYTDVGDICKNRHDPCNLSDPKIQKALVEVTKNVKAFHQPAQFFFYNSEWGKHANYGVDLEARFYQYLWPYKEIQKKAEDFIERKFANKEFAVVHIRNLEKTCYHRQITHNHGEGKVMCNMEYNTFMEIMENVTGRKDLPVFVAFDGEDKSVIKEYQSHGAIFYDGECTTTSCPLVDFEIAARSNFFAGTVVSTASVTIDFLRMYRKTRDVGKYYPSVLSWSDTEEGKKYNQGSPIHNTELKPKKRKGI